MFRGICFAAVVVLVSYAGVSYAQTTQTAVAPLAVTAVTLDGIISPGEWDDANMYTFDASNNAANPGWGTPNETPASDFSCTFYVKHDAQYIYVATAVVDDIVLNDSGDQQWNDDSMEIYFDSNNSRTAPPATKENDPTGFQMAYKSEDLNGVGGNGGPGATPQWWWAKAVIGAPGYVIEFRVEKAQTGMVTGGTYGFELSPDDDDGEGGDTNRDNQIWWNNTARSGDAWNFEQPWGWIVLSPDPKVPPVLVPDAPSNLTATAVSASQVFLAWTDNSNDEDGFRILRSPNNTTFTEIGTVAMNVTGFVDGNRAPGTQYYYKVVAYNTIGNSTDSNTANATTAAASGPIIEDLFAYPENSNIIGQAGGIGWTPSLSQAGWLDRYSVGDDLKVIGGRVVYTGEGDRNWAATSRIFADAFQAGRVYYASWDTMMTTTSRLYPSFFNSAASNNEVLNVGLVTNQSPVWVLRAHRPNGSNRVTNGPALILNQAHHVDVQLILSDATSDTINVWVNANAATTTGPQMADTIELREGAANPIDRISFDYHNTLNSWMDNFRVTTQPMALRNFMATPGGQRISLSWEYPTTAVLARTVVVRRTDRYPTSPTDGTVVYDGSAMTFENVGLTRGVIYYYTAFGYDAAGTRTDPVTAFGQVTGALGSRWWELYQ